MNARRMTTVPLAAALALAGSIAGHAVVDAAPLVGQTPTEVTGRLWVEGGSTVRSWDCAATRLDIEVARPDDAANGFAVDALAGAVSALRVGVPTAGLDCDDRTMNGHMWDALDTERHPLIELRMQSYRVLDTPDGPQVELVGTLRIKGETRPATVRARVESEDDGLRVRGVHTLNMTDFGVKPPRLMFGALRVHQAVEVHFDLLFSPMDG